MNFYSPKNFKNGRLIFNRYRVQDILLFSLTLVFSLLSVIITLTQFRVLNIALIVLELLPACIGFICVQTLSVYHNFMIFAQCYFNYRRTPKRYIWEGIHKYEIKKE
jgi:uncharacterized membrane protein